MKEIKKRAFTLITLLLCLPLAVAAQEFYFTYEGQTLMYNVLDEEAKTCEVARNRFISGNIIIPTEAYEYVVISIGDWAFADSGLYSVTIPNSITSIGFRAFENCIGLTSITIPSSVTEIAGDTFYGCSDLTSILVEDGNPTYSSIQGILYDKEQTQLVQVPVGKKGTFNIPSFVTNIGDGAFRGCHGLTYVNIPSSVTHIGYGAFESCSGLTTVNIPSSILSIAGNTFRECSSLTSVYIPTSVTSIWGCAFFGCNSLTSVIIPSSVTEIGDGVFAQCNGLTSIFVEKENPVYSSVEGALYDKEQIQLIQVPVGKKNTIFDIPSSVTQIGNYAFWGCNSLTSVNIPSSVTKIGNCAFYGCSSLISVNIPSSVTIIGGCAFESCNSLTSVTIPSSVTEIGLQAFHGCSNLTSVNIPSSITSIRYGAFRECRNLKSVTIPSSVTSIEDFAFFCCSDLTFITIPNSVISIGDEAFGNCRGLKSVIIPNSVTEIGDYAFSGCNLKSVTIPNSVTSIGYGALKFNSLREIMLLSPSFENLEDIGYDTPNLQYIYAHKSVIDKWGEDLCSWNYNAQLIELAPIGTIADVLERTDTKLSFRLKPTADDGSVVQTLYYEGKPIEADETGTYRLTGLYPYADIALSADVLRDGEQERAGFYLYAHSVVLPVELRITEAGFATLMLPYDATLPEGVEAYATSQAKEATADGSRTLILEASDGLQANTPYIIKGQPGTYRFSGIAVNDRDTYTDGWLTGTFERVLAAPGTYVLQNNGGVTGFYRVAAGKEPYVGANRAWLAVTDGEGSAAEVTAFVFSDGEATGIGSVAADRRVDVYTQEGVKVRSNVRMADALKALPHGIYIVDGVKKAVR